MNKFKVGDRIRVYYSQVVEYKDGSLDVLPISSVGIIEQVLGQILVVIFENSDFRNYPHYKCCRKVVKKVKK
jgi:hypothetical protein